MKNGDGLTGDTKKLGRGDLHLDAACGEDIFILKWEKYDSVPRGDALQNDFNLVTAIGWEY